MRSVPSALAPVRASPSLGLRGASVVVAVRGFLVGLRPFFGRVVFGSLFLASSRFERPSSTPRVPLGGSRFALPGIFLSSQLGPEVVLPIPLAPFPPRLDLEVLRGVGLCCGGSFAS